MQGIVSALPQEYEQVVFGLWDEMEARFGACFARTALIPHFTWQLAMDDYLLENLIPLLDAFCKTQKPVKIHVSGARLFPGPLPTLYLRIFKSINLKSLHQRLWQACNPFARGSNHLYNAETWVPHITVAHKDLAQENITEALELINAHKIDWHFEVDNLLILRQDTDQPASLDYRFKFGQGLVRTSPSRDVYHA
jgi:2'-5' RNA ligase